FNIIAVDPTGAAIDAKGVKWTLKRLTTSYQWFSTGGSWNYEAVTTARTIAGDSIDIAAAQPATISRPLDWGQYRLEIALPGMTAASKTFSVGYYTEEKTDTPDML